MARKDRPHTQDGRYLVAKGILKRCTNPSLDDRSRRKAVKALMQSRMQKNQQGVVAAKERLGETGPVWWDDGQPDYSGQAPTDTPYKSWWDSLTEAERAIGM